MAFISMLWLAIYLLGLCTAYPDMVIRTEKAAPMPTAPPSATPEELYNWWRRFESHLMKANYLYRSSHSSELRHAQSAIRDFVATATYDMSTYVTDTNILVPVEELLGWFAELPEDVKSFKVEEGRAMHEIWTEAVAWLGETDAEIRPTSTSPWVDTESAVDAIGAAMSTLEILGLDDFPMTRATTVTTGDGATMSTEVANTATSTETAMNDGGLTTVANVAGKVRFGVAGAVMAGVAIVAVVLL